MKEISCKAAKQGDEHGSIESWMSKQGGKML